MVTNQKPTGRAVSMPKGLAIGGGISFATTLIGTLILAKLLDSEYLSWENVGYYIMGMLLLSSASGAAVSYGKIKRQRLAVCLMSGGIYWGMLLSITALFFGGQYEAVGVTATLVLGGSGAIGLLGAGKKGGKRKKYTKHRS